jgi:hypothetical protein
VSDERLQELGRRASTGDVQAAGILLRERMRGGDLDPSMLELAACLGDEAARIALGGSPPDENAELWWFLGPDHLTKGGIPRWAEAADRIGAQAAVRIAIALVEAHRSMLTAVESEVADEILVACQGWVETGECSANARELVERVPSSMSYALVRMGWPVGVPKLTGDSDLRAHVRLWNVLCDPSLVLEELRQRVLPWALGLDV